MARCDFTDLPVEQCGHCQGTDQPEPKPVAEQQATARFPGTCPNCFAHIKPDDTIRLFSDHGRAKREWYCTDCVNPPSFP